MDNAWAYFNGAWIPSSELRVSVTDVGFVMGATVTERLRTFRGRVFRVNEHLRRLHRSLQIVGLDADAVTPQVAAALTEFVDRNRGRVADDDDWTIIAFATPGVAGAGRPTVCVHGFPLQFQQWAEFYDAGLPIVISHVRQVPNQCWPAELKCRSRMHYYLADRAAAAARPGARAVLLDHAGYVAEASTANVLAYHADEGLVTPPRDNILAGVSLSVVEELAGPLAIPFVARRLSPDELRAADEVMLASTSVCLLPVVQCDGQPIGEGRPGTIFRRLLTAWSELVGVDVAHQARRYAERPTG